MRIKDAFGITDKPEGNIVGENIKHNILNAYVASE